MSMPDPAARPTRRLFHEDAYLRQFEARVVACAPNGGDYDVILDRTAFYATSGGQPNDLGRLGGKPVLDVVEEAGVLRHRVSAPLAGDLAGEIDWPRRFDHMQQHTGQHVLSQSFVKVAGAETVSFHLGTERVTIDLNRADRGDDEFARAEKLANEIVQEDREVRVHWTTGDEIGRFPLRKPPKVEGQIRIIEVADFDFSACGGTHVARTGEIGLIKILRREKYKGGVRVEFLCGRRALADYAAKHDLLRRIAERASIQDREVGDLVDRLQDDLQATRKRLREAGEALLDHEAARLAGEAAPRPGFRLVRMERAADNPESLKFLALRIRTRPGLVALIGGVAPDGRAHLVFARSDDVPADMAVAIRAALVVVGGRGGGRPEMAQGSGPDAARLAEALDAAERILGDPAAGRA